MGAFPAAIVMGFMNYVKFSGFATRAEYWYWYLFTVLGAILTSLADSALFHMDFGDYGPLYIIFSLATFLPSLAVAVRRLHDAGYSGLSIFWVFLPIAGPFILLYRLLQPTQHMARETYGY